MRREIRISGFGGQGIGLAGYVLGRALSLYAGLEAVMTQAYGPEARGGASSADIVASDEMIDYPFVEHPDILVALSQEAYARFRPIARPDALILIDAELIHPLPEDAVRAIPATRLADELGVRMATNMVMLGFFTAVTGLLTPGEMKQSIETSVSAKTLRSNMRAFEAGLEYSGPPDFGGN
jgi:2-oxoglutarate ferredoxin oxidoreductase subunit gamma